MAVFSAKHFVYLAGPYSKDPELYYPRHRNAARDLMLCGVSVFAPIVHGHELVQNTPLQHWDHAKWQQWWQPILESADELWVLKLPGYEMSAGVQAEREVASAIGIPIRLLEGY